MSSSDSLLCREYSFLLMVISGTLYVGLIFFFMSSNNAEALLAAGDQLGRPFNNSVPAIFVFGDSTVDPGNNNYVKTLFKGNFPPYGRDFPNQIPTGRFSDGRLCTDFIAEYVGIKEYVPPYLDPTLSFKELMTGVSFASAGSGFDPLTAEMSNVIPLPKQLEYFKEYRGRMEQKIGKKRTQNLIGNALYFVSAGTNDYVLNYFTIPIRRKTYSLPSYMEFLMQQIQQFFQGVLDQGARRILAPGLTPFGCVPIVITAYSNNAILQRGCIDFFSSVGWQHNLMLQNLLNTMQLPLTSSSNHSGIRIVYLDIYGPLSDIIAQGQKYGFEDVNIGCCGTGLLEAAFLCNPNSHVCPDASQYVFWDSIHPTEKTYKLLFEANRPDIDFLIKD